MVAVLVVAGKVPDFSLGGDLMTVVEIGIQEDCKVLF